MAEFIDLYNEPFHSHASPCKKEKKRLCSYVPVHRGNNNHRTTFFTSICLAVLFIPVLLLRPFVSVRVNRYTRTAPPRKTKQVGCNYLINELRH